MTVKELIKELEKVENKDLPVSVGVKHEPGCFVFCSEVWVSVDHTGDNEPCGIVINGEEDEDSNYWQQNDLIIKE